MKNQPAALLPHGQRDRPLSLPGQTLSAALEEYIASVKPGMTEYEITGGLCEALWKHNIDQVLFLVSADERAYKYRHGIPTDKKLEKHLQISVNGRYKGLITTVTRMAHFGKKDPKLAQQYDDTCEIECRSIAAVKIGQDDINAYHANKKAYEDLGYGDMWRLHGQGGPHGYNNRDYVITPTTHGITQVNQCYCYNPVIDGTKTEDAFIVTEEGPLFVTRPVSFRIAKRSTASNSSWGCCLLTARAGEGRARDYRDRTASRRSIPDSNGGTGRSGLYGLSGGKIDEGVPAFCIFREKRRRVRPQVSCIKELLKKPRSEPVALGDLFPMPMPPFFDTDVKLTGRQKRYDRNTHRYHYLRFGHSRGRGNYYLNAKDCNSGPL